MKKHKNLLCSLLFLAILFGLLTAGSWLVEPKNNEKASGMRNASATGYLTERENSMDYLVIGDSETYSSISPMQLWEDYGYTGYVCGTPSQHIEDTFGYLKAFCQVQTPKLVIFEANALYRSSGFQDDVSRIVSRSIEKTLPIFEYHDRWKSLSMADIGQVNYTWRNYLKGFIPTWKSKPWTGGNGYMLKTDKKKEIQDVNQYYFGQIASFCEERNIPFLVVNVPAPVNWNYQKHNGVKSLTKSYDVPYYDMNLRVEKMNIDWQGDSRDGGDHMNIYGAQKVTYFLGKYLAKHYDLPDHRGDPAYNSWDQDLEKYQKTVEDKRTS